MVAMASWLNKNINTLELSQKMATYLNIDVDSETIKKELSKLSDLPTPVSSWLVEVGLDSTEDEAVWVWAMLTEDEVEFVKRKELRSIITKKIKEITNPYTSAYVRFRGASEVV